MFRRCVSKRRAFTMVELVMVVTIIGMLAAIAVPRISSASGSASAHALEATLCNIRKGIDCYYAEHGRFPGYDLVTFAARNDSFIPQLTQFTDASGRTSTTPTYPYVYGPYIRAPFPVNPTNKLSTVYVKATPAASGPAKGSFGWVAVLSEGEFGISATDQKLEEIGLVELPVRLSVRGGAD